MAGALGALLPRGGVRIGAVAGRSERRTDALAMLCDGAQAVRIDQVAEYAPTILVSVSDDAIDYIARQLTAAPVLPEVVLHTSGAAGPDALHVLRASGVSVGVLHPLQTVPTVEAGRTSLPGSTFAYAGDEAATAIAEELIAALKGKALQVNPERWHFYHAAAVMASNYQVALIDAALELMEGAGIGRDQALEALTPLIGQTNENILTLGPEAALTGPIQRGDLGTVLRHVLALRKAPAEIRNLYAAAGMQTLAVAAQSGLPSGTVQEIARALARANVQ